MRYLILLRGIPGSGKSTFISDKYKDFVISPDQLRILTTGIKYNKEGKAYIPQDKNSMVWQLTYSLMQERMNEGSLIIIDATHTTKASMDTYKKYAKMYRYKTIVIDFSDLSLEEIKKRNRQRQIYKQVPDEVIERMYEQIKSSSIPKFVDKVYNISKNNNITMENIIQDLEKDIYFTKNIENKNIVFIGDIHGMYKEFQELLNNIGNIEDKFLVFLGDYFDRFPNEEELLKLFDQLYELQKQKNTYFIRGNHELYEIYLEKYIENKEKLLKLVNEQNTLEKNYEKYIELNKKLNVNLENITEEYKQINKEKKELFDKKKDFDENIYKAKMQEIRNKEKLLKFFAGYETKKNKIEKEIQEIKKLINKIKTKLGRQKLETIKVLEKYGKLKKLLEFEKNLKTIFLYQNKNKNIFANHGGIPLKPSVLINDKEYIKGIGEYGEEEEIAKNFEKNAPNHMQFFGHRDIFFKGPKLSDNTYNLNGSAELGYDLRAIEYDTNKNKIINIHQIFTKRSTKHTINKSYENGNILKIATEHPYIKVKKLEDNIYSLNFTSEAFLKRKIDNVIKDSRGLFLKINDNKEKIIARGWKKFYNINEEGIEESKLENIKKWQFPLIMERKYNGFLGIFSAYKDEKGNIIPFIASKSTNKGIYAEYVKELLTPNITDELLEFLYKENITLLFEVIHPKDPHIEDNKEQKLLFLIGGVKNQLDFKAYNYKKLQKLYNMFFKNSNNIKYKKRLKIIETPKELDEIIKKDKEFPLLTNDGIEGYVIYNEKSINTNNPKMVKLKTRWYLFWKEMRNLCKRISKYENLNKNAIEAQKQKLKERFLNDKEAYEKAIMFLDYLIKNNIDKKHLKNPNIPNLRKNFLEYINLKNEFEQNLGIK